MIRKLADGGITVSVIGLGTDHDSDSELLKDIAKRGGGEIMFANDPLELPRLFTQDTMNIARNTFIKKEDAHPQGIPGQLVGQSRLMGELGSGSFPNVDGYNLCYLKPEATPAVVSQDEYQAPWSAFWYRGLGRVAVRHAGGRRQVRRAVRPLGQGQRFLITHVRWLLGSPSPDDVFVRIDRAGEDAVATVAARSRSRDKSRQGPPTLIVVPPGAEREEPLTPDFTWTGPDTLEARFRMDRTGTYRTLVKTGERKFVRGPAVTLPYSPEFVPRIGLPSGSETLKGMAELSGGKLRTDVLEALSIRRARPLALADPVADGSGDRPVADGNRRPPALALATRFGTDSGTRGRDRESRARATAVPRKWWTCRCVRRRTTPGRKPLGPFDVSPSRDPFDATADLCSPTPAEPVPEAAQPAIDVFQQAKERVRRRSQ